MVENKAHLAIDIGATKTVVAVMRDGKPERIKRFSTAEEPQSEVDHIEAAVNEAGLGGRLERVGIGAPGPLDPVAGKMLQPPNLKGWWNYPIAQKLEERLGVPVKLENDANVGALGEAVFGSGKGYPSVFYITISTGIGAGIVIDGKIFGGHAGIAGEVHAVKPGHYDGSDEGEDIMELASGTGLVRKTKRLLREGAESSLIPEGLDTHKILAAVAEGDPLATRVLEEGRNGIAALLMSALYILSPSMIVLAGGLCTDNSWFVDPVKERIASWIAIPELREIPIARAQLWDSAVLYGAGVLE